MQKPACFFLALLLWTVFGYAQPVETPVKVVVSPDHADWEYKTGEPAVFKIMVMQNNVPVKNAKLSWQVGPERMKPLASATETVADGTIALKSFTLKEPGFLRCQVTTEVDGITYRGLATASCNALQLQPTVQKPADFEAFWDGGKKTLGQLPIDAKMTLLPDRSSALTNVYQVSLQGYGRSRLYGILAVPKKEGKYPALLEVPGAGIRPYGPDLDMADKGMIVLTIGIHGIPVTLDPGVYADLSAGALQNYQFFNADNRDKYYYKRVYLNCIRANDFLVSLPQYDGQTLAVTGGSQGGALSIITASLDPRVKWLAAYYPALSDLSGYLNGRAGGWPHFYSESNMQFYNTEAVKKTLPYYDVVNFARNLKTEGQYSWGFNDETCPPTSMYAAYNVIQAPKNLFKYPDTGHWTYAAQKQRMNEWLLGKMLK
ncbi:MAG: acetylxylan esterase [Williamsia sp.]|nr:acetylxylan esterase [Williamsia sp.]